MRSLVVRVNQLAGKMRVTADTIRYYTRVGILQPYKNKTNGYKHYTEQDEKKLHFALRAKQLGFTIADIQQILNHAGKGKSPCALVRKLIEQRLAETADVLAETQRLYKRMMEVIEKWKDMPDQMPTGDTICTLIENWDVSKSKRRRSICKK